MESMKSPSELDFTEGNLSERWRRWEQTIRLYLTAVMTGKSEKERCATFLYLIGEEGREVYNSRLQFADDEKDKLEPLFTKFKDYCNPKKNLTVLRNIFHKRHQVVGEPIDKYVTDFNTYSS